MGFSRQEYWSGLPFPSPGELPDPGTEPRSPPLQADALTTDLWRKPHLTLITFLKGSSLYSPTGVGTSIYEWILGRHIQSTAASVALGTCTQRSALIHVQFYHRWPYELGQISNKPSWTSVTWLITWTSLRLRSEHHWVVRKMKFQCAGSPWF